MGVEGGGTHGVKAFLFFIIFLFCLSRGQAIRCLKQFTQLHVFKCSIATRKKNKFERFNNVPDWGPCFFLFVMSLKKIFFFIKIFKSSGKREGVKKIWSKVYVE